MKTSKGEVHSPDLTSNRVLYQQIDAKATAKLFWVFLATLRLAQVRDMSASAASNRWPTADKSYLLARELALCCQAFLLQQKKLTARSCLKIFQTRDRERKGLWRWQL